MPSATIPDRPPRRAACPTCGKPPVEAYRPFCSRGCRDRDLLAWFGEDHRIPGRPIETDDQDS